MILARFLKGNIANESIRRMIHRHLAVQQVTSHPPCIQFGAIGKDLEDLSDLTSGGGSLRKAVLTEVSSGPMHLKPKHKQIHLTTSAIQQKRIDDLAAKKHKSEAHKAAMCLYNAERQKPDGLSVRQVQAIIKEKFEV